MNQYGWAKRRRVKARAVATGAVIAIALWGGAVAAQEAAEAQHETNPLSSVVTLMESGDREGARKALRETMKTNPHDARARMLDAVLLALEGRLRDAEGVLTKLIEDHPEHVGAHRNLAMIYAAEERLDEALTLAQKAVEMEPSRATLIALGDMHLGLANRAYRNAGEESSTLIMGAPEPEGVETTEIMPTEMIADAGESAHAMGELVETPIPANTQGNGRERRQRETKTPGPCRTLAREPTLKRALATRRALERDGVTTHEPRRAKGAHTLRWVLSEGRMNELSVEQLLRRHGEGIGEFAVVNRGPYRGRGSYGVFSRHRNAKRRTAQLGTLGVRTVTEIEKRDAWELTEMCETNAEQRDGGGAQAP